MHSSLKIPKLILEFCNKFLSNAQEGRPIQITRLKAAIYSNGTGVITVVTIIDNWRENTDLVGIIGRTGSMST